LLWVGTLVFAVSGIAINAVTMATTIQLTAHATLGRATGTVVLGQYIGFVVGPLAFGALSQRLGYPVGWGLVATGFIMAAFSAVGARSRLQARTPITSGEDLPQRSRL
jgi:MFS family permease